MQNERLTKHTQGTNEPVEMVVKDNSILHIAPFAPEPIFLLSSSDSTFFNTNGGAYLEFVRTDGEVSGFTFYGLSHPTKVELLIY